MPCDHESDVLKAVGPMRFARFDNSERGSLPVLQENIPTSNFERRQKNRWAIMNASLCVCRYDSVVAADNVSLFEIWRLIGRPVTGDNLALLDSHPVEKDTFVSLPVVFPKAREGIGKLLWLR